MQRPALTALRRDWRGRLPEQAAMRVNHVDQGDLQGNVLCGYGNSFAHALYLFVQVIEPAEGRRWIGELAEQATDAVPWPEGWRPVATLNVALSHAGLEALGVPEPVLRTFPEEFREGMAERASRWLGDLGESAPAKWEAGLETEAHVLVTVTARCPEALEERLGAVLRRLASSRGGLEVVYLQKAGLLGRKRGNTPAREHFGFADGFSQPAIRGNAGPTQRDGMGTPGRFGRWHNVSPGEFVLGYKGEDGVIPKTPAEPLRRSGSFTVVRKLQQDVEGFHGFLEQNAATEEEQRVLGAKLVGRWQDGRSLVVDLNPDLGTEPAGDFPERINRFVYQDQDPDGHRCPLGSHVRRANPRDDLGGQFGWHGKLTKRHRIIRRGVPYDDRDWLGERECGLMFVCYQASILRQFEVIQGKWLNDGDAFWLGGETDLLTAGRHPLSQDPEAEPAFGTGRMTIQGKPPRYITAGLPFVTTRGGGYYFTPGLGALRALGSAYWL